MPPRGPRHNENYADKLTQIGMLRGGVAPEGETPEMVEIPEGSGPDYSVEGGEEVAEPAVVGGDATDLAASSSPPLPPPAPPALPSAVDAATLAGSVIETLRGQGVPVDDGVVQGSIQGMFRNIEVGKLSPETTVNEIIQTAIRMNLKHQAAERSALSHEAATRQQVMLEQKFPWRSEKRFKVTINGWVMMVPANQSVLVPYSVYEVLQHALAAEMIVKNMQQEMYFRMTGIPAPTEDPFLYEGYDDHNMRRVAYQN